MLLDMVRLCANVAVLFVFADVALSEISNETFDSDNILRVAGFMKVPGFENTRRRNKKQRETSSSSREKSDKKSSGSPESLELTEYSSVSTSDEKGVTKKKPKKGVPESSDERKGWRKWHRKCPPCPEDMEMKWRDPRIKWICGAYQRARRSFKSQCMMQYRNCQDGTMFTKIGDHRCPNNTERYGDHFFYDYHVELSDDSSDTDASSSSSTEDSSKDW